MITRSLVMIMMRRMMTMIHWWRWYKQNEECKTVPYDYPTQSVKSDGQDTNDEYDGEDPNYDDDDESDGQDPKCKMAASQPRSQKS